MRASSSSASIISFSVLGAEVSAKVISPHEMAWIVIIIYLQCCYYRCYQGVVSHQISGENICYSPYN